jgi:hypothetical protein
MMMRDERIGGLPNRMGGRSTVQWMFGVVEDSLTEANWILAISTLCRTLSNYTTGFHVKSSYRRLEASVTFCVVIESTMIVGKRLTGLAPQ